MAELADAERARREAGRERFEIERAYAEAYDEIIDSPIDAAHAVLAAILTPLVYHYRKGQWRKARIAKQ